MAIMSPLSLLFVRLKATLGYLSNPLPQRGSPRQKRQGTLLLYTPVQNTCALPRQEKHHQRLIATLISFYHACIGQQLLYGLHLPTCKIVSRQRNWPWNQSVARWPQNRRVWFLLLSLPRCWRASHLEGEGQKMENTFNYFTSGAVIPLGNVWQM